MLDPMNVDGMSQAVAAIYSDAEQVLIAKMAKGLQKGIGSPEWAAVQLGEVHKFAASARGDLLKLTPEVEAMLQQFVGQAAIYGQQQAAADLAAEGSAPRPDVDEVARAGRSAAAASAASSAAAGSAALSGGMGAMPMLSQLAVEALAAEAIGKIATSHASILRSSSDVYRNVIADVAGRTVTGAATTREILQQSLDRFAAQGVTGFTDARGRRWHMDTYAEMAARTATMRALQAGHTQKLLDAGRDLVVISAHGNSAPQCAPFQGQIVSLTGATKGTVEMTNRLTGEPMQVKVFASMREAESKGLHHPNCGHRHTLYVPGASRPQPEPYDPERYKNEQKLRYHERQVRAAKRREAAAMTPEAKAKAKRLLKARQARLANHVQATGTPRRRYREQLREGNAGNAGSPPRLTPVGPKPQPPVAQVPRTLSDATVEHVARVRDRLPQGRDGWDSLTALREVRPAESLHARAIWRNETERDAAAKRLRELEKHPDMKGFDRLPYDGPDSTASRYDAAYLEYQATRKKLSRARSQASIEKWSAAHAEANAKLDRIVEYRNAQKQVASSEYSLSVLARTNPSDMGGELVRPITERSGYIRDPNGELRPPKAMEEHLDDVIAVGRDLKRDIQRAISEDVGVAELREQSNTAMQTWLTAARTTDHLDPDTKALYETYTRSVKAVAARERDITAASLREIRGFGGHEQRTVSLPNRMSTSDGDLHPPSQATIDAFRENEQLLPTDWLRLADARGPLTLAETDRAFYSENFPGVGEILLSSEGSSNYLGSFSTYRQEVLLHENGHRMEAAVPGLRELEYTLVRRRATSADGVIEPRFEMYGEGSGEYSLKDDWGDPYTGKVYDQWTPHHPVAASSEAFQVGLQDTFGRGEYRYGADVLDDFMLGTLATL